jgi:hypothetical protein
LRTWKSSLGSAREQPRGTSVAGGTTSVYRGLQAG